MNIVRNNKRVILILGSLGLILLIPLIAMQQSDEVNWNAADFLVAALLLAATGLILEFVLRKVKNTRQRIVLAAILFVFLLVIWVELAVGIFDSPLGGS